MATLTDRAWQYLIDQGVVRDPRVAGALPPAFRQPRDGVPAPGEGEGTEVGPTCVIGLVRTDGIPSPRFEKEWRRDVLDIVIRVTKWPDAEAKYAVMRNLFIDKTNWDMAGMKVIESLEWRNLGLIDSDAQGYTAQFAVLFETYSVDHF
jgi:hypothetical protein